MSFGPISVLGPRFNSSEYLSMRVEDPVDRRGGLNLGSALTLNQNPIFEMASNYIPSNFSSFSWHFRHRTAAGITSSRAFPIHPPQFMQRP